MAEPIELPDQGDNIIRTRDLDLVPDPKGLGHALFWVMKKHGDAIAQIDSETDETDSYATLLTKSVRTALAMKARGVTADDVISLCTSNHINTFVPVYAALFIGAKVAPLDPSLSLTDMKHLLRLVRPKLIFASSNAVEKIESSLGDISDHQAEIVLFGDGFDEEFLKATPDEQHFAPFEVADVFDTALIYFTSGSTGMSKGICLNHYSLLVQTVRQSFTPQIMFSYSPLYWLSSTFARIISTISGAVMTIASDFTPEKTWRILEKYNVSSCVLSPSEAMQLLRHGRPDDVELPHFRALFMGGSHISAENMSALRSMFPRVIIFFAYGQTEIAGGILAFPLNPEGIGLSYKKGNSVGQPLAGMWYKIVDPETEETLGPNQPGELRLKTKFLMNGYHGLDSSDVWDSDGWFRTGDICYYDDDRCFYVVDRLKEMIKYRGWQMSPSFVEEVLRKHPAVKTAVVVGIPHEVDVERALGLVELSEEAGSVTAEELVKYVSDEIKDDRKALHGGIRFVTDIPYTPSGKVKRGLLRSRILADVAKVL